MSLTSNSRRHLEVLRTLLEQDHMARPDWDAARVELAGMAQQGLDADEAMVALWVEGRWEAVRSDGGMLVDHEISGSGSRAVLETVRERQSEVLRTAEAEFTLDSESIREHEVGSFLGVPLFLWDVSGENPRRQFAGCLYAHRQLGRPRFSAEDVSIARDIARLAQPTLNVLRSLRDLQLDLEASRTETAELRRREARDYALHGYRTNIPWLDEKVIQPLNRLIHNDRITLLIEGPTGSGKSHLARAYHHASPRRDGPFVVLDCASVTSAETLGSELFGYARDSGYANAPPKGRVGKARLASGGTLFIDEIGNLAAELQPRLLRLIDEGRFLPLGSSTEETTDLQVIAATNADLTARVAQREFREDLFHRLAVIRVGLPDLTERGADIPDLARDILARLMSEAGRRPMELADDAVRELVSRDWSRHGNIRGLENCLRRAVWATPRRCRTLRAEHLRLVPDGAAPAPTAAPRPSGNSPEVEEVVAAIREHGSAKEAAKALGKTYRQLYWVLVRAGLRVRDVLESEA